jgi:hypothetical protein
MFKLEEQNTNKFEVIILFPLFTVLSIILLGEIFYFIEMGLRISQTIKNETQDNINTVVISFQYGRITPIQ